MTDSQRQKVYDAENAVFRGVAAPDRTAWYAKANEALTEREAQRIADRLTTWLRSKGYRVTTPKVEVTRRGTRATASSRSGRLRLQESWPQRWVLLHEMAHLVTGPPDGDRDSDHDWQHGHQFCAAYLALVRHELGTEAHKALRVSMKAKRVRYTPPRQTTMSADQRAAAAARLAAHRKPPSPHRYTFVRTNLHEGYAVEAVEVARSRGRWARTRLGVPYTGPVYASTALNDMVHLAHDEVAKTWVHDQSTINPERAITRTTIAALERWAESNVWFRRGEWDIVDIADALAPIEQARADAERAAKEAAEREEYAARLRSLIHAAIDRETDIELLELALSGADPAAYEALTEAPERLAS